MPTKPKFEIVSTGSWMTDERQFKTCNMCTYYQGTQYAWLCKKTRRQFQIMDSAYHTTCRNFESRDNDAIETG